MRRAPLPSALALALAACGSSGGDPEPLYGGFTPAGTAAVIFAPTTCSVPFVGPTAASGLALVLTSFPDACGFVTSIQLCGSKGSATLLIAAAVGGTPGAASAPAFAPGTYSYLADPPTGSFKAAIASAAQTTATCGAVDGTAVSMNGGQIAVSTVAADRVTGNLDLRFADGSALRQPFDAAVCPVSIDLCQLIGSSPCRAGFPPWQCVP